MTKIIYAFILTMSIAYGTLTTPTLYVEDQVYVIIGKYKHCRGRLIDIYKLSKQPVKYRASIMCNHIYFPRPKVIEFYRHELMSRETLNKPYDLTYE